MPKTVLAFDFGTQSIGTAIGQTFTATAEELRPLRARDGIPQWEEIAILLREWQPDLLVVGLPLNMDDTESDLSALARKFANRLHGRFSLPVELMDERLSTYTAKGEASERGHTGDYNKDPVDSIAARLILESWFSERETGDGERQTRDGKQ